MTKDPRAVALGRRLRELRESTGLTQLELAGEACTHAYVSTIEAGKRLPSPRMLEHFARRLGVPDEALFSDEEPDEELLILFVSRRSLAALADLARRNPEGFGRATQYISDRYGLKVEREG